MIYHITTQKKWDRAKNQGVYSTPSLGKEGFIHCSKKNQITKVLRSIFKNRNDLILLSIDESKLGSTIRYDADSHGELFPHIYGPLNLQAVIQEKPIKN